MPTATECLHGSTRIDVDRALELKAEAQAHGLPSPPFRCIECNDPVKPHRGGGHAGAHFEHFQRNSNCSLSHRSRHTDGRAAQTADYELNDAKAIEGYELDRKITSLARNASIVAMCKKRDKHTCQACGFRLEINGKFVTECHHTKPLAAYGAREVSLDELVCLCPTCHRIAHTRKEPFSVREIKALLGQP
jgi:hypothetical protein